MTATTNTKRVVGILFAMVAMALASAAPAFAYLNTMYDLPDWYGTDADAKVTSLRSPGTSYGSITINNYGRSSCTYVQRKPVAPLALDGDWKRSTPNNCGGISTHAWSDTTHLSYSGYKFRICKDVSWGTDPCSSSTSATIYSYR